MTLAPPLPAVPSLECLAGESTLALALADAVRPRERVRPSEWAEAHVVLDSAQTPRPGPVRCDFKPWTQSLHDLHFDHPEKMGAAIIKPGQVGASRAMLNVLACLCATDPGPALYLTTDKEKAANFSSVEFGPLTRSIPALARLFADDGKRQLLTHREFAGGVLDFVGAGSETGVISVGRRYVFLDEYELSSRNMATSGSLIEIALGRVTQWKHNCFLWVFSHPALWEQDIHGVYLKYSTRGVWLFDCPHCGAPVDPTDWEKVVDCSRCRAGGPAAEADPSLAACVCPSCAREVSDTQRAAAVQLPARGGSAHLHSAMPAAEQGRRPFVGLWLTALMDPAVGVRELAAGWLRAERDPLARRSWLNKTYGAPYREHRALLTVGDVSERLARRGESAPGGAEGVRFVVVGVDVQAPRMHPTLYCSAVGFGPAAAYLLAAEVVSGWAGLAHFLRGFRAALSDGRVLGVRGAGIDCGYETSQVLDFARTSVYSEASSARVWLLPLNYNDRCHADNPAVEPPEAKCVDPTRPHLGPIKRYYLHRHSWVDRAIRRVSEGRLVTLCTLPREFAAHVSSNVMQPVRRQHGLEAERMEWQRPDELRDDWLQSLAYAEAAAALECGLDRMLLDVAPPAGARPGVFARDRGRGWWSRER